MAEEQNITDAVLRNILDYDPKTGIFIWRTRHEGLFQSKRSCSIWNARYAGKVAGSHHRDGYWRIRIFDRDHLAHRLAWAISYGEWPGADIDHENLNKADNRLTNLRIATRAQNCANRRKYNNNTSGFKGVSLDRSCNKWRSHITKDGRYHHLGLFDDRETAHAAYVEASKQMFGEYARGS